LIGHNTLAGVQADMPNVTDAFVATACGKGGQPQSADTFAICIPTKCRATELLGYQPGQPTIGVSKEPIDSVSLGKKH